MSEWVSPLLCQCAVYLHRAYCAPTSHTHTFLCHHTSLHFILSLAFTVQLSFFSYGFPFMSGRGRALRVCQSDWLVELLIGWSYLDRLLLDQLVGQMCAYLFVSRANEVVVYLSCIT